MTASRTFLFCVGLKIAARSDPHFERKELLSAARQRACVSSRIHHKHRANEHPSVAETALPPAPGAGNTDHHGGSLPQEGHAHGQPRSASVPAIQCHLCCHPASGHGHPGPELDPGPALGPVQEALLAFQMNTNKPKKQSRASSQLCAAQRSPRQEGGATLGRGQVREATSGQLQPFRHEAGEGLHGSLCTVRALVSSGKDWPGAALLPPTPRAASSEPHTAKAAWPRRHSP